MASETPRVITPDILENPFNQPPELSMDTNPTISTPRNNQTSSNPTDYADVESNAHSSTHGEARRPFSTLKEAKNTIQQSTIWTQMMKLPYYF